MPWQAMQQQTTRRSDAEGEGGGNLGKMPQSNASENAKQCFGQIPRSKTKTNLSSQCPGPRKLYNWGKSLLVEKRVRKKATLYLCSHLQTAKYRKATPWTAASSSEPELENKR